MLSHKRLFMLIDTYGAVAPRWPDAERADAEELLRVSEQARAHLAAARLLDTSIRDAARLQDADMWGPGDQEAALARVRSLVGVSISGSHRGVNETTWSSPLAWAEWFDALTRRGVGLGLAFGCSLAVAVGVFLGSAQSAVSTSHDVLAILQPALLQVVTD